MAYGACRRLTPFLFPISSFSSAACPCQSGFASPQCSSFSSNEPSFANPRCFANFAFSLKPNCVSRERSVAAIAILSASTCEMLLLILQPDVGLSCFGFDIPSVGGALLSLFIGEAGTDRRSFTFLGASTYLSLTLRIMGFGFAEACDLASRFRENLRSWHLRGDGRVRPAFSRSLALSNVGLDFLGFLAHLLRCVNCCSRQLP